jgi:hypothetical protein
MLETVSQEIEATNLTWVCKFEMLVDSAPNCIASPSLYLLYHPTAQFCPHVGFFHSCEMAAPIPAITSKQAFPHFSSSPFLFFLQLL